MTSAAPIAPTQQNGGKLVEIVTPEGIPLRFTVASPGQRLAAFFFDGAMIVIVMVGVMLSFTFVSSVLDGNLRALITAAEIFLFFFIRTFYFIYFETRWRGATPGKRRVGLRVIDRNGGPLRTEAVFVRNITREIEISAPLMALIAPNLLYPDLPVLIATLASGWLLVFIAIPFFHRSRLRVGDILAGTIVVEAPRELLYSDIAAVPVARAAKSAGATPPEFTFTQEQLEIYGIHELQVLEKVLRDVGRPNNHETSRAVCEKIKIKIQWDRERWDVQPRRFLESFYAAQRAHLEQKMLFGKRKERKRV